MSHSCGSSLIEIRVPKSRDLGAQVSFCNIKEQPITINYIDKMEENINTDSPKRTKPYLMHEIDNKLFVAFFEYIRN